MNEQINSLNKLSNIKNQLNQKYYNNVLNELGIYEQNVKYFKPVTDQIAKQTEDLSNAIQNITTIKP